MTDYDASFETLWSMYPKRNGRKTKKHPAYKKWQSLDSEQKAALRSSVEKHNRQQSWGKYVRDLVTYINQRGWEDSVDDPAAPTARYHVPESPPYPCTKWESLANRWLFRWLRAAQGLPETDLDAAVKIKNGCVKELSGALDEDLVNDDSRESQMDAMWTFMNVLIDRLDQRFGRNLKRLLLKGAKT